MVHHTLYPNPIALSLELLKNVQEEEVGLIGFEYDGIKKFELGEGESVKILSLKESTLFLILNVRRLFHLDDKNGA